MAVKKFKPTTPSRREMTMQTFEEITSSSPEKSLLVSLKKQAIVNYFIKTTTFI